MYLKLIMSNDRKYRSLTQRMYLVESLQLHDGFPQPLMKAYMIMGSTGNIYKVTIANQCSCTCPDHLKRQNVCKHIYFVLLRIMKVEHQIISSIDQSSDHGCLFLNSELVAMFDQIPKVAQALCVSLDYHKRYLQTKDEEDQFGQVPQRELNDLCPICLDDLLDPERQVDYCKYSCGKSVHKLCLQMWLRTSNKCMFCCQEWDPSGQPNQYINLGIDAQRSLL